MADELMDRYAALERMMMEADERGEEPFADSLRDLMDSIWYRLSDEEHHILNGRGRLSLAVLYPVTFPISDDITLPERPRLISHYQQRSEPWVSDDWRLEAA
jgi:hypothetical protein